MTGTDRSRPTSVYWQVNCACDERCAFCFGTPGLHDVDPVRCAPVLDSLLAHGLREFVLVGGEPLLAPRLGATAALLRDKGASVGVITNTFLWDYHRPLLERSLDVVGVLLEGASEMVHDSVRGPNTLRAVEAFLELYSGSSPFEIVAHTLVGRHNLNELDALIYLLDQYGVKQWVWHRVPSTVGRRVRKRLEADHSVLCEAEFQLHLARIRDRAEPCPRIVDCEEERRARPAIILDSALRVLIERLAKSTDRVEQIVPLDGSDQSVQAALESWSGAVEEPATRC